MLICTGRASVKPPYYWLCKSKVICHYQLHKWLRKKLIKGQRSKLLRGKKKKLKNSPGGCLLSLVEKKTQPVFLKRESTGICSYTVTTCKLQLDLGYQAVKYIADKVTNLLLPHKDTYKDTYLSLYSNKKHNGYINTPIKRAMVI